MDKLLLVSGWILCGMWLLGVGLPLIVQWWRRLPRLAPAIVEPDHWPSVSVVVTAKDEGPQIADCLSSLLASDYPDLELIAINDRSSDETGPAIDSLATTDPRIRPLHITELPSDWLGKNHAMWCGAQAARGSWILFTDGDIIYRPETIRVAVSFALSHRLDHLTLAPSMLTGSYAESSLVSFFALIFAAATQSWLTRLPTRHIYVGVGAFNLVRRKTYESAGGHLPLRYDVADDLRLGQLLKRHGCRADMLLAGSYLKVKWQESAWSTITGLEKNGFAGFGYSVSRALLALSSAALFLYAPLGVLVLVSGPSTWGFAAALAASHLCYAGGAVLFGASVRVAPCLVPASAGIFFAFIRSMVITLRQGGVRWRDTFYPLSELRRRLYR